jgi:hypothetical protein
MAKKFKVYELDFGDTNLLTEDAQGICDWIKSDLEGMDESDELNYTVTIRMMTRKQIDNIPEWA